MDDSSLFSMDLVHFVPDPDPLQLVNLTINYIAEKLKCFHIISQCLALSKSGLGGKKAVEPKNPYPLMTLIIFLVGSR